MLKVWIAKMRQRGTIWMAVGFLLIGFAINFINPNYGIGFSVAGLVGKFVLLITALVVALAILLVDNVPNKSRELIKLTISNWIVLLVVDIVAPLSTWLINRIGF